MPNRIWKYAPCITSLGGDFGIAFGALGGGSTPSQGAFPASNDGIFVPVYVPQPVLIKRLYSANGGTASGNIDVGIFSEDGYKLTSNTNVTHSGTSVPQYYDITDLIIGAGTYYLGVSMDNTSGQLFRTNTSVRFQQALGVVKQASAYPLPSQVTFATPTASYIPLIGAEIFEVL